MPKRYSIYIDGFGHVNPIPAACRIGDTLMSGIVHGLDPAVAKEAASIERQCALMFERIRVIVQAAGGTTDDIVKMTVWLKDRSQREPINREWEIMFPDPANRPARQAMAGELGDGILVQCDFVAMIG